MIATHSKQGQSFEVRWQCDELHKAYAITIANRNGSVYVTVVREAPELTGKLLHGWAEGVTYDTLTADEIQRSVKRANAVNRIKREVIQAVKIWTKANEENNRVNWEN